MSSDEETSTPIMGESSLAAAIAAAVSAALEGVKLEINTHPPTTSANTYVINGDSVPTLDDMATNYRAWADGVTRVLRVHPTNLVGLIEGTDNPPPALAVGANAQQTRQHAALTE